MSNAAQRWTKSLPVRVRPAALCSRYPRIVNRLALCWTDPALTDHLFDELMVDRRGKRRGFPPEVAAELLRLREWSARQRPVEDRTDHWDDRLQAIADR